MTTTFVITIRTPSEAEEAVKEACHKIVDDGRFWDLITEATAEEGTEAQWEKFTWGGDATFEGTTAEFRKPKP